MQNGVFLGWKCSAKEKKWLNTSTEIVIPEVN